MQGFGILWYVVCGMWYVVCGVWDLRWRKRPVCANLLLTLRLQASFGRQGCSIVGRFYLPGRVDFRFLITRLATKTPHFNCPLSIVSQPSHRFKILFTK